MFARTPQTETCNRLPPWLDSVRRRLPGLCARYATFDARSLGLLRIYLALLLLTDLLRRVPYLKVFYTNAGLLPNHMVMWRPRSEFPTSFFFLASLTHEVALLFVLCGVVFVLLLVGYRTRLFQVLSLICICSLHGRVAFFDDGSEGTTRLLAFWTAFLPLGARFSVDSVHSSLAAPEPREKSCNVVSLAVTAILLQLAFIYLLNVLHKDGATWREGSAVHYVLHQDRIVTWLGWKLRPHLTLSGSRILSWLSLGTEALLPILILSPVAQRYTRRLAIVCGIGLHLGFALLLNLGLFSFNMIGFFLLLLSADDWQWLARALAARPRLQSTWISLEHSARAWCVRVLHAWESAPDANPPALAPWPRKIAERAPFLREACVVLFVFAFAGELSHVNRAAPAWMHVMRPELLRMLVVYPHLYQGWSMFAPDAPKDDMHLYVDAVMADGRHVDPLNQLGSRVADPQLRAIPERLEQDDEFCDYVSNIAAAPEYHGALQDWIYAYSDRTGHTRDRIVAFKVWILRDDSPPPGATQPGPARRELLLKAHR